MSQPIYTSRLIKATALLADTHILFSEWDLGLSIAANFDRFRQENIFGKASRARTIDILKIFRQRYFSDPQIGIALVKLSQRNAPSGWLTSLMYFFSAQNDRTMRDIVVDFLYPRSMVGYRDVTVEQIERTLQTWVAEGKMESAWSDKTVNRVARHALASLRDFGVLEGAVNKRLSPFLLPTQSFALISHWLHQREKSGHLTLHSEDWKLFFLPIDGAERFFIEAHQMHLLSYHTAGSITRIEFPAETLPEYVDVILERTY